MAKQYSLALLLLAGLALGSCSSDDDVVKSESQPQNEVKTYHASAVVSLGGEDTRALSLDGNILNAEWENGEKVYVLKGGTNTGFMSPTTYGNTTTTLEGTLEGSFAVDDAVTLRFPRAEVSYLGQDGTLGTIASKYDYAELVTTVTAVEGDNITIDGGVLENKQAIVKFTFSEAISSLSISSDALAYSVSVTPSNPTEVYVALPIKEGAGAATYTFTVFKSGQYCILTKNYTLVNGQFYKASLSPANWEAAYVDLQLPSGTKFAKMNVGATSETEVGTYFALGEVTGYTNANNYEKNNFTIATYKWANGDKYTKYVMSNDASSYGYNGFYDDKYQLDPEDDAATMNWNSDWRAATVAQWSELASQIVNNPDKYTVTQDDNGVTITCTENNAKLFLPYSGLMNGQNNINPQWAIVQTSMISAQGYEEGNYVNYRSNLLGAFYLSDVKGTVSQLAGPRYGGYPVRAVYVGN